MNTLQRFFLVLTLSLLLLGLAAHSAPAFSLCACADSLDDATSTSGLEACLVCQLQGGAVVCIPCIATPEAISSGVNHPTSLSPLECAGDIPHPPIL